MKFILNNRIRKFVLNSLGLRFRLSGVPPVGPTPVTCEVTYDDDTCLMYDDGTFAEYD